MWDSSGGRTVSSYTSQADATRMHVTSGFCPGKGAKHNLGQGQRGQPEVKEKQAEKESFQEKREAEKERERRLRSWQAGELKWKEQIKPFARNLGKSSIYFVYFVTFIRQLFELFICLLLIKPLFQISRIFIEGQDLKHISEHFQIRYSMRTIPL